MAFEDSMAVRLSSTCWGSVKVDWVWSPGRAVSSLTCLSQELFLAATRLVCFSRKFTAASFSLTLTSFFSSFDTFDTYDTYDTCDTYDKYDTYDTYDTYDIYDVYDTDDDHDAL